MKFFVFVELVCALTIVNGIPWLNYRGFQRRNSLRRIPWYRNQNTDNSWPNADCNGYKSFLEGGDSFFTGNTRNGYLCIKFKANLKLLTSCAFNNSDLWVPWVYLFPTVVNSRQSLISNCDIYDVTIRGQILDSSGTATYECVFMLMDGILVCVDEVDLSPQYQLLTIFPTVDYNRPDPYVNYLICNQTMGNYCSGPAKVASIVVEDEFQNLKCTGRGTGQGPAC